MSLLLSAEGTFLHMSEVQSLGDMPLRLSMLSVREPRLFGVVVATFDSEGFAESVEKNHYSHCKH